MNKKQYATPKIMLEAAPSYVDAAACGNGNNASAECFNGTVIASPFGCKSGSTFYWGNCNPGLDPHNCTAGGTPLTYTGI
ncbi:MAG: hypothetical protein JW938_01520 [Candidatus Omnitrophica bacterium]|nr:hypothetical protein [Candidatus Omnitrophota bacterium]